MDKVIEAIIPVFLGFLFGITACLLVQAFYDIFNPEHDPDGAGVDLSGQGRSPKPKTNTKLNTQNNMNDAEIKNAIILNAMIGDLSGRGFLTVRVLLEYEDSTQTFCSEFGQYFPGRFSREGGMSIAGHTIWRIMEIARATSWDGLPGKTIRVKADSKEVYAIGHIIKDDWFCPQDDYIAIEKKKEEET